MSPSSSITTVGGSAWLPTITMEGDANGAPLEATW